MVKTVIRREMLGSREQGFSIWSGKEVIEMTAKEISSALLKGEKINGLKLDDSGGLVLDDKFFTRNIMEHRMVGSFKPLIDNEQNVVNVFYIILGKNKTGCYEMISTKFERGTISEDKLRALYEVGVVSAGVKIEAGKVILPEVNKFENGGNTGVEDKKPQK